LAEQVTLNQNRNEAQTAMLPNTLPISGQRTSGHGGVVMWRRMAVAAAVATDSDS
jgi:hypothetical protein